MSYPVSQVGTLLCNMMRAVVCSCGAQQAIYKRVQKKYMVHTMSAFGNLLTEMSFIFAPELSVILLKRLTHVSIAADCEKNGS